MAIQRTTIKKGPAAVVFGGQTIYTADDIKVVETIETFPIESSAYGKTDERVKDIMTEITFTPQGIWTAALLAVLFPHTNPLIGGSLFGATDVPCVVHPLNGEEKISYAAAAITKMPDIVLSNTKTAFGSMTITCIGKNSTVWTAADKRFTITASAAFSDTSYDVANIPTIPYSAAFASFAAPFASGLKSVDGFSIAFNLATTPIEVDDEGIVDHMISGLDISLKFRPAGVSVADVLTLLKIQGAGAVRGRSLAADSSAAVIAGAAVGDPTVTVNGLSLKSAPQDYGLAAHRHGEIEFVATRPNGSGAMFSVGVIPSGE